MLRMVVYIGLLLLGLLHALPSLRAQEPARMNGAQAVRFEQNTGFFHYVAFCRTPREFMARLPTGKQMPEAKLPPEATEYALCWYVSGSRAAGGKGSQDVDGRLVVSEHHVRFVPGEPRFADAYADLPREQTAVKHEAGQPDATLVGKGLAFSFRFSKLCLTCAPGTPAPPGVASPALLDQEFALLDETILHFYSGWRQIYRLSSGAPADPPPGVQPANAVTSAAAPGTSTQASAPPPSGTPKAKPVRIASADGLLVKKVPPDYPLEARMVRLEGTVVLRAVIDKAGEVSEVSAVSGPSLLEPAAVDAVKQWQYRPYSVNGQPVDVETTIAVVFALDGSRPATRIRASASGQNP